MVRKQESDSIQSVEVGVSDTGVGISKQNQEKLFRIDVHHSTPGTAKEQGTGLGLVICKEMVEKNGGYIWVESELGKGTTVKFTVPLDNSTHILWDTSQNLETGEWKFESNSSISPSRYLAPSPEKLTELLNLAIIGDMGGVHKWPANKNRNMSHLRIG